MGDSGNQPALLEPERYQGHIGNESVSDRDTLIAESILYVSIHYKINFNNIT